MSTSSADNGLTAIDQQIWEFVGGRDAAVWYGDRTDMVAMDRIEAVREAFWRICGCRLSPRDLVALEFKTFETRTPRDSALLAIIEHLDSSDAGVKP